MSDAIGAIAVVISIADLAIQIRSNTRAMKASASLYAAHSWAEFYLYKHGYLEPGLWQKRRQWCQARLAFPFYRACWKLEMRQAVYTDEFVSALLDERAESISVGMAGVGLKRV